MYFDPHTLQQIIERIQQQMRCPQCGKHIPVDFAAVRLAGDDFMLLQLRCDTCDAYIVLHASLQESTRIAASIVGVGMATDESGMVNASSTLSLKDEEVQMLRGALQDCGGSFEKLFDKYGPAAGPPSAASGDSRIA